VSGRGLPVPAAPRRATVVLLAVSLALYVIARTTGAGWDVVLMCAVAGTLVVAALLPAWGLLRIGAAVEAPRDAIAGHPFACTLSLSGHGPELVVRVEDPPGERVRARAGTRGTVTVVPPERGVLHGVRVELRHAGPLGLFAWRRCIRVPLAFGVEVAPRRSPVALPALAGAGHTPLDDPSAGSPGAELTRGARAYVDGDPIRLLHWPATARTGTVLVREMEGPRRPRVVVVADLRGPDPESAASRAAAIADDALRRGARVELATAEPDGPCLGEVVSTIDVGRRLARAVPGVPAAVGFPSGAQVLHVGSTA